MAPKVQNYKEYRTCRYLYYFVIPTLEKYLWFDPDRDRIRLLEHTFYNLMLSYRFRSAVALKKEPNRVFVRAFRSSEQQLTSVDEVDTQSAKL